MSQINYKQKVSWDANIIDVGLLGSEQSVPSALRGLASEGTYIVTGAPAATVGQWAPGAVVTNAIDATLYQMTGTTAAPVWSLIENSTSAVATFAYNSDATAGPLTIPAAKMVNAMLDRNGGTTTRTDTSATATQIIAQIPGAIVGSTFEFVLRNVSTTAGQQIDFIGGTGVTISGTSSIFANGDITYIGIVTNVGTPAVTLYAEADSSALIPAADVASSVNTLQVTASATGNAVLIAAVGSDTNVTTNHDAKGSGAVNIGSVSTGQNSIGLASLKPTLFSATVAALGTTQNSTPSAAQLIGGIVTQTGATGAGTFTLPTGTLLSAAFAVVPTVGQTFQCIFTNLGGGQTITITGATGTTVVGKAATATATSTTMTFINTGANTWTIYGA